MTPELKSYTPGQGFAFKLKTDKSASLTFKVDALEDCAVKIQGEDPLLGALRGGVIYEGRYDYDVSGAKRLLHITSMASSGNGIHVGVPFSYPFKNMPPGARDLDGNSILLKANRYYKNFYNLVWTSGVKCTYAEYAQELKDHFGNCGKFGYEVDADGDINIKLPCIKDHIRGVNSLEDLAKAVDDQVQNISCKITLGGIAPGARVEGAGSVKEIGPGGGADGGAWATRTMEITTDSSLTVRAGEYTEVRSVQYRWMMQVANAVASTSLIDVDEIAQDMAKKLEASNIKAGTGVSLEVSGNDVTINATNNVSVDATTIVKDDANTISAVAVKSGSGGVIKFWTGTQTEYDALISKDNQTLYIVLEGA